ncbi:MAG: DUF2851 family protein [Verrucomicrobiota bacterium]
MKIRVFNGLTLGQRGRKKQQPVFPQVENFYADWRVRCGAASVLHDENSVPPERLLQAVWRHQRLLRDQLKTAEGARVRVFHPGFLSVEGGPDFRGAVVQIGDQAPRTGDVEVDLRASGWHAHGHDRNPHFQNVLLHVVWDETAPGVKGRVEGPPAVVSLKNSLDAPLAELGLWLENESAAAFPEDLRGKCSGMLREWEEGRVDGLLRAAAQVRLEAKAAQFHARARQAGWEQALWEGLFRGLGYKHNGWPMQNVAEARRQWVRGGPTAFGLQARLLGLGGLLPAELPGGTSGAGPYLRRVWDCWWREREEFSDQLLPRAAWRFHGLRPANHPARRLALAAHWLADENFIPKIEKWIATEFSMREHARKSRPEANPRTRHGEPAHSALKDLLQVEHDDFWSWHWTFRSARLKRAQPLLGAARVTDLAVNVILPWLWTRAREGRNEEIRQEVEERFFAWPAAEDNSVLKLARQRLLGGPSRGRWRSAAGQQGLLQIVHDFCGHSNAVCENCRFPELVGGSGDER